MGSLTSRPKVPAQQPTQIVYVPAQQTSTPALAQSTSASSSSTATDNAQDQTESIETTAEQRADNLLSRDRSRFGTVQTSFRGLLSLANNGSGRKTLLGE